MTQTTGRYRTALAQSRAEVQAAQRLRYDVFVTERGGTGPMVDHQRGLEVDAFDAVADHLLLWDGPHVVGAYRLLGADAAAKVGGFYSQAEFDLTALRASGGSLLELGRSCIARDHRGGTAMMELWGALGAYIQDRGINLLFGVASFPGTDVAALTEPISLLHHAHLAPPALRVVSRQEAQPALVTSEHIDRVRAMRATPALIKAYLRLGGTIGQGVFVDHAFNTTDVCLVMDTAVISARHKALYQGRRG